MKKSEEMKNQIVLTLAAPLAFGGKRDSFST